MQRSRNDQNPLTWFLLTAAFAAYEALSMRYLFFPPLFGLLLFWYIRALDTQRTDIFIALLVMFVFAEAAKGYPMLSMLFFYTLSYFLLLPKLTAVMSCRLCLNGIIVIYAYFGYWAFLLLLSNMFAFAAPHFDFRIIFYVLIEFFLVGLL